MDNSGRCLEHGIYKSVEMVNIVILASGSGSNAEVIIRHFQGHPEICVKAVWTNNPRAGVIARAENLGIPVTVFSRSEMNSSGLLLRKLKALKTDLLVLAGFLWLMPPDIISAIPTINIHPALLPKYGGKGMYGMRVHRAVKENGEEYTGITIHEVNEQYDQGDIIFQEKCSVLPSDSPEDIQRKVQKLEHAHYPLVIEKIAENTSKN